MTQITRIPCAIERGDPHAAEQLMPLDAATANANGNMARLPNGEGHANDANAQNV